MSRGVFITFEGPEGSGKSTHLRRLTERLRAAGRSVVVTREPGGTPVGEALRGLLQHDTVSEAPVPRAEALLFCASRAQLVERTIAPALARGDWVLCDRFADSTFAYQGYGRGFDLATLEAINRFATGDLRPDLTILLDIEADAGRRRLAARQAGAGETADRFEREAAAFHERLRRGFLSLAAAAPTRFLVIDSGRDEETVAAEVWTGVMSRCAEPPRKE
ncbi:MAG: dTMP kinase [Kiritimatiellae bacterium]|nr:dTMP kinase [Kiritimatiellia bacterium]